MGAKILSVTTFVVAILIAAVLHTAEAETHSVSWSNSVGADFYTSWAANQTFKVGDTLVFEFTTGVHDVAELGSKNAFDACNSTGVIGTPKSDGPANYSLSAAGDRFFICQVPGHCDQGQKLSITVTSASTPSTPAPAPSNTTPPPPTSASPPSEATTPPPSGATTPPPSGATTPPPPSTSAPPPGTTSTTAPPPEGSTASTSGVAVVSSVFMAIAMAFFCLF